MDLPVFDKLDDFLKWDHPDLVDRAVVFIESFCVAPEGHTAGELLKVLKWQREHLEAILNGGAQASVLTLPKGQGKSTWLAAVACWLLFDSTIHHHFGREMVIWMVADTIDNATETLYGSLVAMVEEGHEALAGLTTQTKTNGKEKLMVNLTGAYARPKASTHLNGPSWAVAMVDEIGYQRYSTWSFLRSGMTKRPKALLIGVGTKQPGTASNALDALLAQRDEIREKSQDPLAQPRGCHIIEYAAPLSADIDDRAVWRMCMPSYAEGIIPEWQIVDLLPPHGLTETEFRVHRLNQKVGSNSGWLGPNGPALMRQQRLETYIPRPGAAAWLGVDIAHTSDHASVVICFPMVDDEDNPMMDQTGQPMWFLQERIWTPEPGTPINANEIVAYILDVKANYDVLGVDFDPRLFREEATYLQNEGVRMIEHTQFHSNMVGPVKDCWTELMMGRVWHNGSELFVSHMLNATPHIVEGVKGFSLKQPRRGGPDKIDSAIATVLAVSTAIAAPAIPEPPTFKYAFLNV